MFGVEIGKHSRPSTNKTLESYVKDGKNLRKLCTLKRVKQKSDDEATPNMLTDKVRYEVKSVNSFPAVT